MTKVQQSVQMMPGDSKTITIDVVDTDGNAIPTLADSVAAITWMLKKYFSGPAAVTKTMAAGDITISGSQIIVTLAPADTEDLGGTYVHECDVTDLLGNVSTILIGEFKLPVSASGNAPVTLDGEVDTFTAVLSGFDFRFASNSAYAALL
jgi:hypothetical protein